MDDSQFRNPSIWGRSTWKLLHCISMTYPKDPLESDVRKYNTFLNHLKHVLPCKICRKCYSCWIKKNPPRLESRRLFVNWVIDLHNYVNERLGKPILPRRRALIEIKKMCRN